VSKTEAISAGSILTMAGYIKNFNSYIMLVHFMMF